MTDSSGTLRTYRRRALRAVLASLLGGVLPLLAALLLSGQPAAAASPASPVPLGTLTEVTHFGYNPTGLGMHLYVPKGVTPHPAILVAAHWCTGTGPNSRHPVDRPFAARHCVRPVR
jgi:acetylxylan esterase